MKVTLTFDNGPEPDVTPGVLDCLARHDIKATFFVMGRKAISSEGSRLVEQASVQGHRIGNHTFSHTRPLGELSAPAALEEFERAESVLIRLIRCERLFRPYGRAGKLGRHLLHPVIVEKMRQGRYTCVLWSCVPGDWRDPDGWLERAIAECQSRAWSLVVLHDTPTGAMLHLDSFIQRLRDQGAEFTQEYPPDCLPIVDGRIVRAIAPYVSEGPP